MHCPSCGKCSFANHDTVSRYMTQPKSGCSFWFNDLVRIRQDLLVRNGNGDLNDVQAISIESGTRDERDPLVDGNDQMSLDEDPQSSSIEYFPGATWTYRGGSTFIDKFHTDEFSNHRASNIYYLFTSAGDWELGLWLLCSGLSMNAINSFLSLDLVCLFYLALSAVSCSQYHAKIKSLPLSFRTAKELRGQAELLPSSPRWKSQECYVSPLFFFLWLPFLDKPLPHTPLWLCRHAASSFLHWLCQTCTIPVPSCIMAMFTCVQLCLWQPIAFLPFTSCSTRCLSEAICTCIYKP